MDVTAAESFCVTMLPRVSRTFALGIAALPTELRRPVMVAYLICRVADAFEDDTRSPLEVRREALAAWRADVLAVAARPGGEAMGILEALAPPLAAIESRRWPAAPPRGTSEADDELLARRADVLAVFATLAPDVRRLIGRYAAEMAEGMARFAQSEKAHPIATLGDLDRYCYYVAGTVGHVLTGLFTAGPPALAPGNLAALRASAEGFGEALQLVNIIKDAAADLREGRCFIPRDAWGPDDGRDAMRAALLELSERALALCRVAQSYVLALPAERLAARQFCCLALHLALLTLAACRASPSLADPERPVKISRSAVAEVGAWVAEHAGDDAALAARFEALAPAPLL